VKPTNHADMKVIWFAWTLLLLVVSAGCNQQPASPTTTNQAATKTARPIGATNTPANLIPHPPPGFVLEGGPATNANAVAKSIEETRAKAEKGDALAQLELGRCYIYGKGVPQSYEDGVKWIRKGVEQNVPASKQCLAACYAILGLCYDSGLVC
jgi:TPR repeat protein